MPKILVFAGSTRNDSINRNLARLAAAALRRHGAEVTFADLQDYPMPLYNGDLEAAAGLPAKAKEFKELVREQDGLLVATPEHNGSFSALLKNVIDWISRAEPGEKPLQVLRGKTAALIAGSPSPRGGQRGLRHTRELLEMIGVQVIPTQVAVPGLSGTSVAQEYLDQIDTVAKELVEALRAKSERAA